MLGGALWALGGVGITLALVAVFAIMKMAQDNDRAARHSEKSLVPHSDVTITELESRRGAW